MIVALGIGKHTATGESTKMSADNPESLRLLAGHLHFSQRTGWISWYSGTQKKGLQLCWLPMDLRGHRFTSHESVMVIFSDLTYQPTIIDFMPMLEMFHRIGAL